MATNTKRTEPPITSSRGVSKMSRDVKETCVPGIIVDGGNCDDDNDNGNSRHSKTGESPITTSNEALTNSASSVFTQDNAVSKISGNNHDAPIHEGSYNVPNSELRYQNKKCVRKVESVPIGAYCSPRLNRRQRSGSYPVRDLRYPARELSSLRADGYLKAKTKSSRVRVDSGDSRESGDTLDNISHLSTCATSDYAFMTSLDTLNLCRSCTSMYVDPALPHTPRHRRPLSLDVDTYSGLRRTHSNPENCQSELEERLESIKQPPAMNNRGSFVDSDDRGPYSTFYNDRSPYSTLKSNVAVKGRGGSDKSEKFIDLNEASDKMMGDIIGMRGASKSGKKSIAVSEENLVSRVSRWLSTMEQPESRDPDTY